MSSPVAALTLLACGSMRFRWNETNAVRSAFFSLPYFRHKTIASVELIHSHIVFAADAGGQTALQSGDGIISRNSALVPVITVADCMPIFIYEPSTSCIGVLHSGWKGTGIVLKAFEKAEKEYGADISNFRVILGPHIRSCCYTVDEERARFFQNEFSPDCVCPADDSCGMYRLSLEAANRALLKKAGIKDEHIFSAGECTCCTKNACGSYTYGSFRRETADLPQSMSLEKKQRHFTPMAAFIGFEDTDFSLENLLKLQPALNIYTDFLFVPRL